MLRDVLSVLELRIGLETEAAGMAAIRRTPEQLAEMRRVLDAFHNSMLASSDTTKPDFEFHVQIARATSNRYYIDIMNHLGVTIIPRTRVNSAELAHDELKEYLNRMSREHEDIYAAIARSDADAARAAMRTHLGNSRERLRLAHEASAAARR
jgi:DNA-binding FadR family transcriptional regulator